MGILAYSVAYSGLQNASQRMNVANNNIANLNTPFYRREVLNQSASLYLQQGYDMFIGTGVKSDSTSQIKDEQLFTKEMNQQQDLQFSSTFKSNLSSIESLFNDVNNQGLSSYLQSFNTAMTKMSLSPTDNALATTVINTGKDLTNYTNMVNTQINNEKTFELSFLIFLCIACLVIFFSKISRHEKNLIRSASVFFLFLNIS